MKAYRDIDESTARCVSIAVFYHNSPKTHHAEELFKDDVRSIARWVAQAGLGEREADRKMLEPLSSELVSRYGVEVGSGLHADFLAAYRIARRSVRSAQPGQALSPASIKPQFRGTLRE